MAWRMAMALLGKGRDQSRGWAPESSRGSNFLAVKPGDHRGRLSQTTPYPLAIPPRSSPVVDESSA